MDDLLVDILTYFNFPVIRQGSMAEDETYPHDFFTFWNNSSEDDRYYNNAPTRTIWDFDVNFYSAEPGNVSMTMNKAIEELRHAGFIISGKGYDVPSDEPTHTGRGINVLYVETH